MFRSPAAPVFAGCSQCPLTNTTSLNAPHPNFNTSIHYTVSCPGRLPAREASLVASCVPLGMVVPALRNMAPES
ncbi:unnamed protein product [Alternaria burnsii]|nr:unnamed protein product [Alternaria burnsii]